MKRFVLTMAALLALAPLCRAQFFDFDAPSRSQKPVKFEYDVDFWYYYDNREFDTSNNVYYPSGTTHGVLVTPYAGFSVQQGRNVNHRFMLGMELCRIMGAGETLADVPKEVLAFYDMHATSKNGKFEAIAGIFPRNFQEAEYTEAIYRGGLKFGDRNFEGCLLKYANEKFYAEIGLDWMGHKTHDVKEMFQIFSGGRWDATDWLRLGWSASMHHFGGSEIAPGVVDEHLLNPYVKMDFGRKIGIQTLSLKAGALLTYQWNRAYVEDPITRGGGEFVFTLRNWNVCLQNTLYLGENLQPYFYDHDTSGEMFGSRLYMGNPFYRNKVYDVAELIWSPRLTDYLSLSLIERVYCGIMPEGTGTFGIAGNQQICSLVFDLDKILNPKRVCGKVGTFKRAKRGAGLENLFEL